METLGACWCATPVNAALSSNTPGDIAPANISINGAKFYENQFLLDGTSINSNISGGSGYGSSNDTPKEDSSQGLAVDTKLLCNITVHDSNVSAEYGRFMGGVIEAEVCAPRKKFGGDVSLEYSSSNWMERKFDGPDNALSSDVSEQNKFKKWTLRSNMEAQVSDRLGLVGSFSRKQSTIPLMAYSKGASSPADASEKNAHRQIDNYYLKAFYDLGSGAKTDFSVMVAPSESELFRENTRNSRYEQKSGGQTFAWGLVLPTAMGQFENKLSYRETQASRLSDSNEYISWQYSAGDKNWAPEPAGGYKPNTWTREGGYGDIEQKEKNLAYKWKFKFDALQLGAVGHTFTVGGDIERDRFSYSRLNDYTSYMATDSKAFPTYTTTCDLLSGGVDSTQCSLSPAVGQGGQGQFLNYRSRYSAGSIKHDSNYFSLYLEDAMQWRNLSLRLGARVEKFSDAQKIAFAPRVSAKYAFGDAAQTSVFGGANRYFGQHLRAYQIASQKDSLSHPVERRKLDPVTGKIMDWEVIDAPSPVVTDNLKLPYTDELTVGFSRMAANLDWKVQYNYRKSQDEIVMQKKTLVFSNDGESRHRIYTISASTVEPWVLAGSKTNFAMAWDYTKTKSSHSDWSSAYLNEEGLPENVYYQGAVMGKHELPTQNYARPWTLRLMSSTEVSAWGVRVDGIVRIRQAYQKVASNGTIKVDGVSYTKYEERSLGKTVNFDIKVSKQWKLFAQEKIYADLKVENLFNRSNPYDFNSSGYFMLEKGRQVTLRVGYEF